MVQIKLKSKPRKGNVDGQPEHKNDRADSSTNIKSDDKIKQEEKATEDRGRKRSRDEELQVEEDKSMAELMGFSGFGTTKNKKVPGTDCFGAHKVHKVEYRQYINREKGFNRPLSPTRQDRKNMRKRERKSEGKKIEGTSKCKKSKAN